MTHFNLDLGSSEKKVVDLIEKKYDIDLKKVKPKKENLDFKLFEKGSPAPTNTDRLLLSLHYKFGYGIKLQNRLFIIPSIETPIINFKKWEKGKSTYGIFNSRYRPFLFSVRFLWLKPPGRGDCPPVYLNPDDKLRYERNYME